MHSCVNFHRKPTVGSSVKPPPYTRGQLELSKMMHTSSWEAFARLHEFLSRFYKIKTYQGSTRLLETAASPVLQFLSTHLYVQVLTIQCTLVIKEFTAVDKNKSSTENAHNISTGGKLCTKKIDQKQPCFFCMSQSILQTVSTFGFYLLRQIHWCMALSYKVETQKNVLNN